MMKRLSWMLVAAGMAVTTPGRAQEESAPSATPSGAEAQPAAEPAPEKGLLRSIFGGDHGLGKAEDAFYFSVDGVWQDVDYARNALHTRSDDEDSRWNYEEGSSNGDGYGLRFGVRRAREYVAFTYFDSSYEYENTQEAHPLEPGFSGYHKVDTDRRDLDLCYYKTVDPGLQPSEAGYWGWILGFRYIDLDNTIEIFETGIAPDGDTQQDHRFFDGGGSWKMLNGGYFGVWQPFGSKRLQIPGSIKLCFGEADGPARQGSDDHVEGYIHEDYADESSLAYGAGITAGIKFDLTGHLSIGATYGREWLYSFDATDDGTVVFPDNDDALFIENQHAVTAYLGLTF